MNYEKWKKNENYNDEKLQLSVITISLLHNTHVFLQFCFHTKDM